MFRHILTEHDVRIDGVVNGIFKETISMKVPRGIN